MRTRFFNWLIPALLFGAAAYAVAEEVTLTTYYPSPRGVYSELRTTTNTFLATDAGRVGIGTSDPQAKLEVTGTFRLTDGSQGSGRVLTSDANGLASWQPGVPSGAVMFFNLSISTAGWATVANATGRYLVAGTPGVTVGTALSNGEDRPVGQHTHAVIDPGHTHPVLDPGHNHGVSDPGHSHTYSHPFGAIHAGSFGVVSAGGIDIQSTSSNTTGISIQNAATGISIGSAGTNISVGNAGSVPGTNAPYLQLLACQRT